MSNAQTSRRKKWNISLEAWFLLSQYLGAVIVSLGYCRLLPDTWLWPESVSGPRAFLMLWVLLILGLDLLLDRVYLRRRAMDLTEINKKVRNGGLHVKTFEALAAPALFIVDAVMVVHMLLSQSRAGAAPESTEATCHAIGMAAGIVLWVYGRLLPRVRFQSVWGIRTKASLADVQSWGKIHLRAQPWVCLCGGAALVAGTFLTGTAALSAGVIACALAFAAMFLQKAD